MRLFGPVIAAGLLLGASLDASADMLGPASDYGVFIFGTGKFQSQNTESQGNVAVGGDVALMNYSVAAGIPGNPAQTPNPARLVVGGYLTASNGGVGNGQNGTIYDDGPRSLSGFTYGNLAAQTLVDFGAATTLYQDLSTYWGSLAATGTTSLQFGTLSLDGGNSGLNVFALSAADLTNSGTVNITAPTGSTVLINVYGDDAVFQNGQVSLNGIGAAYVLYNFVDATSVALPGSKDPQGSILAPLAGVVGSYGHLAGQLVAGSYGGMNGDAYGHTEFGGVLFAGDIPAPVPLPAAAWLMVGGLGGLGSMLRRRRGGHALPVAA